jgi:PKD repeat protein
MSNVFRGMVFVIGLAVVIGSILVTSAEDAIITIYSPSENEIIDSNTITVSGDVTGYRGALIKSVTVNGELAVGTGPNGGFSSWEKIISFQKKGKNTINVTVTDIFDYPTTKNRRVYYITPPSAPQNLQLTAGDGYVNLRWSAPSDIGGSALTRYKIYKGTSSGRGSYLAFVSLPTTSYNDTKVINNQIYYYQVSAVNSVGEGEKSKEVYPTPTPTPTLSPTPTPTLSPTPTPTLSPTPTPTLSPTPTPTLSPTPTPPVCSFRCSTTSPEIKEPVKFDASESCDHDGKIKHYWWDFGDGTKDEGIVVRHSYSTGGTYTVKLIVIYEGNGECANETIIVINRPPTACCRLNPSIPETNELITFDASPSEDPDGDGDIKGYKWDFGDGGTGEEKIVYHKYSQAGDYPVKLTVTDVKEAEGLFNLTVSVKPPCINWEKFGVFAGIVGILLPIIGWIFSRILKTRKENKKNDDNNAKKPEGEAEGESSEE